MLLHIPLLDILQDQPSVDQAVLFIDALIQDRMDRFSNMEALIPVLDFQGVAIDEVGSIGFAFICEGLRRLRSNSLIAPNLSANQLNDIVSARNLGRKRDTLWRQG